jgi:Zn-dependent protease with chaperone function
MKTPVSKQNAIDPHTVAEWDKEMIREFNARQVRDPHLLQKAEEYAKRLDIKVPLLYVAEEFPAIYGGKAPNAMALVPQSKAEQSAIVFTRQQFAMHGFKLNSGAKAPNEVLATLGHEMGHLKQGGEYLHAIRKYPGLIGLAGALAGIFFLNRAIDHARKEQKNNNKLSDETIKTALKDVTGEERERVKQWLEEASATNQVDGPLGIVARLRDTVGQAGEYAAGGLMGFIGGKYVTRQLSIAAEFDADKVGAEMCGDPRASIRDMRKSREYLATLSKKELDEMMKKVTLKDAYTVLFDAAHPDDAERIKRLEAMAVQMEGRAEKLMSRAKSTVGALLERISPALVKLEQTIAKSHIRIP